MPKYNKLQDKILFFFWYTFSTSCLFSTFSTSESINFIEKVLSLASRYMEKSSVMASSVTNKFDFFSIFRDILTFIWLRCWQNCTVFFLHLLHIRLYIIYHLSYVLHHVKEFVHESIPTFHINSNIVRPNVIFVALGLENYEINKIRNAFYLNLNVVKIKLVFFFFFLFFFFFFKN